MIELFAAAAPGLEPLVRRELRALGIESRLVAGGAELRGDLRTLYAANLHLRTASRILVRLGRFPASAFHELERRSRKLAWEQAIRPGDAVSVRTTTRKSRLYHSDAVSERILSAIDSRVGGIVPAIGAREGDETQLIDASGASHASVSRSEPADLPTSQLVVVRVDHDQVTVSLDASGALLHLRGFRRAVARAPLRETLAAALVLAVEWDSGTPLVDPMCGSGTIPIEAALIARCIPPGLARRFAFERWPTFDATLWSALREEARELILPRAPAPICGSDRDAGAIESARANAERAGVLADLSLRRVPLSAAEPPGGLAEDSGSVLGRSRTGWIVTNPPYGVRVGGQGPLRDLYARLGQVARTRFPGWGLALLSADPALERQLGLRLEPVFRTRNGGIPVRMIAGRVGGSG